MTPSCIQDPWSQALTKEGSRPSHCGSPACCLLTCEASVQVDDQWVVLPVEGGQQVEEAQEPHLGRAAGKTKQFNTSICSLGSSRGSGVT